MQCTFVRLQYQKRTICVNKTASFFDLISEIWPYVNACLGEN
jgi:hypothetical protein